MLDVECLMKYCEVRLSVILRRNVQSDKKISKTGISIQYQTFNIKHSTSSIIPSIRNKIEKERLHLYKRK